MINIDTDMIIPKQFLKTIKRSGLGVNLFDEMRFDDDGNEIADFRSEPAAYREAKFWWRGTTLAVALAANTRPGRCRFRHPLRDRAQLRGHLLQQLFQERHPADRSAAGSRSMC